MAGHEKERKGASQEERHWVEKRWGGLYAYSLWDFGVCPQVSSKFFIGFASFWIISLPESQRDSLWPQEVATLMNMCDFGEAHMNHRGTQRFVSQVFGGTKILSAPTHT